MAELIFKKECFDLIGACYEIHRHLGHGFLEAVYAEALGLELKIRNIPFEREKVLEIHYKEYLLEKKYVADFICYGSIIIELKALSSLITQHEAQILNYLIATGVKLGLLVNFGEAGLKYKRLVL